MTTRTVIRSSRIGYDHLSAMVEEYLQDDYHDVDEFCESVISWVNRELPGSYNWLPHISEVYADIDETEELTEEELMEYISDAIDEVDDSDMLVMNTMESEAIMFEEAKRTVEGTDINYLDLVESVQSEPRKRRTVREEHEYWEKKFADALVALTEEY